MRDRLVVIKLSKGNTKITMSFLMRNEFTKEELLKKLNELLTFFKFKERIPIKIEKCENPKIIYCYIFSLLKIIKAIFNESSELDLSLFNLIVIPPQIKYLKSITSLDLSYNNFEEIPKELYNLKNLKKLQINNNQLKSLSSKLLKFKNLQELNFNENFVKSPPVEILSQGLSAIQNFYREIEEQGVEYIYEAKLILVGEPGAGKTSLTRKLLDPNCKLNPSQQMTKGIAVKKWIFPYNKSIKFRTNIWDFGGQEIMHSTHRYFLTKRSLYILLSDNRKEDTDFYFWLNNLDLFSSKSPVIIVLNEKFNHKKYIPDSIVKSFDSIDSIASINLANNKGLKELSKKIQAKIKKLPHVGHEPIPKKWLTIRKQLEKRREDYIELDEYLEICKNINIEIRQSMRISEFLHDLGVILHFQHDILLQDLIILNTNWATEAVYLILFDAKVINKRGRFNYNDLKRVWGMNKYPQKKHAALLKLMVNFELCYQIQNETKPIFIVPQLLPEKPVKYEWDINDNIHFEYRYSFMPKGLISRLIVRLNSFIYNNIQWKNGIVLKIEDAIVEIIEHYHERKLKIRISNFGKLEALAIIRKEIFELNNSYKEIEYDEMLACICPECKKNEIPYFFKYDTLKKYKIKSRKLIVCEESIEEVLIESLLNGLEGTTKVITQNIIESSNQNYSGNDRKMINLEILNSIESIISKDNVEKALELLNSIAKRVDKDISNQLILLTAKCKKNNMNKNIGIVSNDNYNLIRAQISFASLNILRDLEEIENTTN